MLDLSEEELDQIQGAIDWVRGRREIQFSSFPVGFAFTPGAEGAGDAVSHVILLRRKSSNSEPYFWFLVRFRNFRFQVPVPFSPADESIAWTRMEHFQSLFPPSWPRGETTFSWLNWSGTEKNRTSWVIPCRITARRRFRSRGRVVRGLKRLTNSPSRKLNARTMGITSRRAMTLRTIGQMTHCFNSTSRWIHRRA
jgi:hypothetical protein